MLLLHYETQNELKMWDSPQFSLFFKGANIIKLTDGEPETLNPMN